MSAEIRHGWPHSAFGAESVTEGVGFDDEGRKAPADATIKIDATMRQKREGEVACHAPEQSEKDMSGCHRVLIDSSDGGSGDLRAGHNVARLTITFADPSIDLAQAIAGQSSLD